MSNRNYNPAKPRLGVRGAIDRGLERMASRLSRIGNDPSRPGVTVIKGFYGRPPIYMDMNKLSIEYLQSRTFL